MSCLCPFLTKGLLGMQHFLFIIVEESKVSLGNLNTNIFMILIVMALIVIKECG